MANSNTEGKQGAWEAQYELTSKAQTVLVISPLWALMLDQEAIMMKHSIKAQMHYKRHVKRNASKQEARQLQEGTVGEAAASTQPPTNAKIQKCMQTVAAESVIQMGYQPEMVQRAIERVLMKKGIEELTGAIIMDAIFSIEEEEETKSPHTGRGNEDTAKANDGHETEGGASSNEPSADKESAHERIRREYQELRDASLCKVCMVNTICVVFLPCSHLVTCASCAPKIRVCPICRSPVKATAKAYFG